MYDFVTLLGRRVELCDDCGFNGAQVTIDDVPVRLSHLRRAWSDVLEIEEALLRRRPSGATWCALEYGAHTASMVGAIEWVAREFTQGRAPGRSGVPVAIVPAEDATDDNHDCSAIVIDQIGGDIEQTTRSFASFAQGLSAAELNMVQDYDGGGLLLTVEAVICHALHDAEHHVLDVRRGIATMLLEAARDDGRGFWLART